MDTPPPIKEVHYRNFRVLKDATLPLERFTLIVGPNGSGKSTALKGLEATASPGSYQYVDLATAEERQNQNGAVTLEVAWGQPYDGLRSALFWYASDGHRWLHRFEEPRGISDDLKEDLQAQVSRIRVFSFEAEALARPVDIQPRIELAPSGANLAAVLDAFRDRQPERFAQLNAELAAWLPEYDGILFDTPRTGAKAFSLRTSDGHHPIQAHMLSQGTLFALAMLCLSYVEPNLSLICLEEPDRGIHPRLLRDVQDALYRIAYPDPASGRRPIQVVATTHSPYLLDLFSEHPEEVVIAQKDPDGVRFDRLSAREDLAELLEHAHLSDIWYSGVLGGVPVR